jgi:biotin carboxylase
VTIALLEALSFGLGRLSDAAAKAGHRLCLLTADRSLYIHELGNLGNLGRPDADQVEVVDVDTTDVNACEAALRDIPDLAGLINSTDTWAIPGAELARRLGLPGPALDTVRTLRDKGAVRSRLHRAGLSRAPAVRPDPADDAGDLIAAVGLPMILKDAAGTSSRAVWLARDRPELEAALAYAGRAALKGHLVAEPYFPGPLYSAETVSWRGHTRLLGISSRILSPEPVRREEASAFPVVLPDDVYSDLDGWIGRVLAAVGFEQGFAHTELVLAVDGPEVVEVNGRIAGAVIGEAMCRALGTNVHAAMVDVALGEEPPLLHEDFQPGPGAALVRLFPACKGTLTGWSGIDRLAALPGNPEWFPTARPGDRIEHLSDQRGCTGIVLAEGPTAALALDNALASAGTVTPLLAPDQGR